MKRLLIFLFLFLFVAGVSASESQSVLNNKNTVGVVGGSVGGTYAEVVYDLAVAFDDGYDFRVVPILGRGSLRSIEDLLYLKGVDVALMQSDTLDFVRKHKIYTNIEEKIRYIAALYDEEIHILSRNTIEYLDDLRGMKVNFGPELSGTFMTASLIFEELNIVVDASALSFESSLKKLKEGQLDAIVVIAGAPVSLFHSVLPEDKLHFLPITQKLKGSYVETTLKSEHYPILISRGDAVKTVAVGAVMAAYNWPVGHPRREKVDRLVDAIHEHIQDLRDGPYHDKWDGVNLNKTLQNWKRWK